jgi:DNA topoisomerase VI subunit B
MLNTLRRGFNPSSFRLFFSPLFPFTNKSKKALADVKKVAKELKKKKQEESVKYDFSKKDAQESFEYDKKLYYDKSYMKIMNNWKLNLQKKQKAKAIIKERFDHYVLS